MSKYLIIAFVVAFILFWIWALLDLASSTFKKLNWKLAWLLIILFLPLLGSVLYLLLKRDFKAEKGRNFNPGFISRNLSDNHENPNLS